VPDTRRNPFLDPSPLPYGLPPFADVVFDDYAEAFELGMAEQRAEVAAVVADPAPPTVENTVVALERSGDVLARASHAFFTLTSADATPEVQQLQAELAPRLAAHHDAILLDPALFARIDRLEAQRVAGDLDLDPETDHLLLRTHLAYVRAGAALLPAAQTRLAAINQRLATLAAEFSRRLLADTNDSALLLTDPAELAGLPPEAVAGARQAAAARGQDGYLLTLALSTHQPPLVDLRDRSVRRRLLAASQARGSRGNAYDTTSTLIEILTLRAERAALLGYPSHADYVLADRTAGSVAAVEAVLDQVIPPALAVAEQEAAELTAALRADVGPGAELEAADWAYYAEQVRAQRYAVDTAALRPYFELETVLADGLFYAAGRLYGISLTERPDLTGYHPDARVFEVHDADGSPLGLFVGDYFTRDTKKGGAWMNFLVSPSGLLGHRPVVVNNLNLTRPAAGEPVLLSLDEVTTLFHEFGHALHGLFSTARYPSQSGTSVARDFVEYPSQVNEMWITWPEVLTHYARHHVTGEPLDPGLGDALRRAAAYGSGFDTIAYAAAAWLDLCWHRLTADQVQGVTSVAAFEAEALARRGLDLPVLPPRYRSGYFAHVFSGAYAAGYYSYLWSEILDADTAEWFREQGGLVRAAGDTFRAELLSRGGSAPELGLFEAVRGRPADLTALLRRRGLLGSEPVPQP
jgi:peptidyl-dipeptidase Dcp